MRTELKTLPANVSNPNRFYQAYLEFIKYIAPSHLGQKKMDFLLELKDERWVLCVDHDKRFNQTSSSYLCHLTKGFVAGWIAKELDFTKHVSEGRMI